MYKYKVFEKDPIEELINERVVTVTRKNTGHAPTKKDPIAEVAATVTKTANDIGNAAKVASIATIFSMLVNIYKLWRK